MLLLSDAFFTEMSQRFNKQMKVAAVDVDLFVNCIDKESQVEEAEHVLMNLRQTRRTRQTLESTHHAVCRFFLQMNAADRLLHMIQQPIQYGIFPDNICYNLLIDHFLAEDRISDAAQTATLFMLQEDFSNPLTNLLVVHAVLKFLALEDRPDWYEKPEGAGEEAVEEVDEDDVEHIRIPYLRNPYFDDHFDLVDTNSLCGKTLFLTGLRMEGQMGQNLQLLGLCLFQKWSQVSQLLREKAADVPLCSDVVPLVSKVVDCVDPESAAKSEASAVLQALKSLPPDERSVASLVSEKLSAVPELEREDGEKMSALFENWIRQREIAVRRQMDDLVRDQRIKEIIAKRRELHDRKRLLFFFENLNKHELELEEAEKKLAEVQSKSQVEEEYVPPSIHHQPSST